MLLLNLRLLGGLDIRMIKLIVWQNLSHFAWDHLQFFQILRIRPDRYEWTKPLVDIFCHFLPTTGLPINNLLGFGGLRFTIFRNLPFFYLSLFLLMLLSHDFN